MEILIQNTGSTPLFINIQGASNGTTGVSERLFFEADGKITTISEELFEKKVKNNAFFKRYFENGQLINLNTVGMSPAKAQEQAVSTRELQYLRYLNVVKMVEEAGGVNNPEVAMALDRNGLPKLDLLRANLGPQVDPQKIEEYAQRYLQEKNAGMHSKSLRLPGGVNLPLGKKGDVSEEQIASAAAAQETADKAKAKAAAASKKEEKEEEAFEFDAEVDYIPRKELVKLPRTELEALAEKWGIDYNDDTSDKAVQERLLKFQSRKMKEVQDAAEGSQE